MSNVCPYNIIIIIINNNNNSNNNNYISDLNAFLLSFKLFQWLRPRMRNE